MSGRRKGYVMPEDIGISSEQASSIIQDCINKDQPCMIARFGAFEISTICNYQAIISEKHSIINFIKGKTEQWWWNEKTIDLMESNAGFFPSNPDTCALFAKRMIDDTKELDILALWTGKEKQMPLPESCQYIPLLMLEPYWSKKPWTKALEGKKVVVVHPFAELITSQYKNHSHDLFGNPDILPEFQLRVVKAVQSIGGESNGFKDWFDALHWMEKEIDKEDYDICLLGCGAYGFPLAAHCKRMGKKAVHLGGALQLLFGIKGRRWENPEYCKNWHMTPENFYIDMLSNENWIRPEEYQTKNSANVEGSCYW